MATQSYAAQPAPGAGFATPTQPGLQTGAAPEKKGIAEKVKGLLGGHGHKTDATAAGAGAHPQPVYGDATPTAGNAESTRVGCLDKIKAKAGVGHGLAPEQARAQGHGYGDSEGVFTDPSASPDFNGGTNVNSSAAVHGGWPHPTNPNQGVGAYAEPHHAPGAAHPSQVPGTGHNQLPGSGYNQVPGTGHNQVPGSGYDQVPGTGHNQVPGSGYNQVPGSGYNQVPGTGHNQVPGTGYNQVPGSGHNQVPGSGYDQVPGSGYDQVPGSGYNQVPGTGLNQVPGTGHNQVPGTGHNQVPGTGHNQVPGTGHNQVPGTGYDQAASGYGDPRPQPQPMNPTGVTNAEGGAVLHDHHGNVHEGPRDDTVKKEGFVSKIMDKLHSPKGKPAHTATTTTPASY